MSEHAQQLFEKTKALFKEDHLNHTNVFKFLQLSMEIVELNEDLSGAQKKALVIETLKIAAKSLVPDEDEFVILEQFIDLFVNSAIDEIVEVSGNTVKINVKRSRFYKCFTACSGLFGRRHGSSDAPTKVNSAAVASAAATEAAVTTAAATATESAVATAAATEAAAVEETVAVKLD